MALSPLTKSYPNVLCSTLMWTRTTRDFPEWAEEFSNVGCFEIITSSSHLDQYNFFLLGFLVFHIGCFQTVLHIAGKTVFCACQLNPVFSWPTASLWLLIAMATTCPGFFRTFFFVLIQIFCHVVKPCVRLYVKGYVLIWVFKYDYELLPRWLSFILSSAGKASSSTPFITLAEDFYISLNRDCLIPVQKNKREDTILL